jgi:hypothetical protein
VIKSSWPVRIVQGRPAAIVSLAIQEVARPLNVLAQTTRNGPVASLPPRLIALSPMHLVRLMCLPSEQSVSAHGVNKSTPLCNCVSGVMPTGKQTITVR